MSRHKKPSKRDAPFSWGWNEASDISRQSSPVAEDTGVWTNSKAQPSSNHSDNGWGCPAVGDWGDGFAAPYPRRSSPPGWGPNDGAADSPAHSLSHSSRCGSKATPPESSSSGVRIRVPSNGRSHSTGWGCVESRPAQWGEQPTGWCTSSSPMKSGTATWGDAAAASSAEQLEGKRHEALIAEVIRALEQKYDVAAMLKSHNFASGQNAWSADVPIKRDSEVHLGAHVGDRGVDHTCTTDLRREQKPFVSVPEDAFTWAKDPKPREERNLSSSCSPVPAWPSINKGKTGSQDKNTGVCENSEHVISMEKNLNEIKGLLNIMLADQHRMEDDDTILDTLKDVVGELQQLNRTNKTLAELLEKVSVDVKTGENADLKGIVTGSLPAFSQGGLLAQHKEVICDKPHVSSGSLLGAVKESSQNVNTTSNPAYLSDTLSKPAFSFAPLNNTSDVISSGTRRPMAAGGILGELPMSNMFSGKHTTPNNAFGAMDAKPFELVNKETEGLEAFRLAKENMDKKARVRRRMELTNRAMEIAAEHASVTKSIAKFARETEKVQPESKNTIEEFRKLDKDKATKISHLEIQKGLLEAESEKANLELAAVWSPNAESSNTYPNHEVSSFGRLVPAPGMRNTTTNKLSPGPFFADFSFPGASSNGPVQPLTGPTRSFLSNPDRMFKMVDTPKPNAANAAIFAAPTLDRQKPSTSLGVAAPATSKSTNNSGAVFSFNHPPEHVRPFAPLREAARDTASLVGNPFGGSSTGNIKHSAETGASASHKTGGFVFGDIIAHNLPSPAPLAPNNQARVSNPSPTSDPPLPPAEGFNLQHSAHSPSVPGAFPVSANGKKRFATVDSDDEDT